MLLYKYLFKKNKKKLLANYKVSVYINSIYLFLIMPAVLFMNNGLFCRYYFFSLLLIYIYFYRKLDKGLKSYKRNPIITYEDRYIVIESLRQVNNIIKQNTLDYTSNLLNIRPDFVVHGDDWITGPQKKTRDKVIEILKE